MSLSLVSLICFAAVTLCVVTAMMVYRDMALSRGNVAGGISGGRIRPGTLRRRFNVFDEVPARNLGGRIDQAFDHLVLESGYDMVPIAFFLLLIASGLLVGGGMWLYYGHDLTGIAGMMLGMTIPMFVLAVRRARRMREVLHQLPYVLDLMARAVRAGESLEQAVALVGSETEGILGREFAQCARQMEMGRSIDSVMKSLAARIRLIELRILATTVAVHRQAGGNLADTLERMANVVRERISARRQMRAATGAGRASALLIATISPAAYLVMFLWQPEHVRVLYDDPLGLSLLSIAIVLEAAGILWVFALLKNEA